MSATTLSASFASKAGHTLPTLTFDVTQEMINAYAKASGDFNPIHVDPVYAKGGPFGRTIAHGLMTLAFVAQLMNDWSDGQFDRNGEIDIAFVGPVFAGERVELTGIVEELLEQDKKKLARVKLICTAGGRQVLAGFALQPLTNGKA